jgi:PAS domain S-box-containing protein
MEQSDSARVVGEPSYRVFADNSPDWEYWVGPDGRYRYVSPACQAICGHAPEEFIADPDLMSRLVHPDDRPFWLHHTRMSTGPGAATRHDLIELRIRGKNGDWLWIEHCCNAMHDTEGVYLGQRGINRDISRRKAAERDLGHMATLYATLRAVYQAIVRTSEETRFLDEICRVCVSLGGLKACVVSIGEEGDTQLYPYAFRGLDAESVDAMPLHGTRSPAWDEGRHLCLDMTRAQPIAPSWAAWARRVGIGAWCHYPIRREGKRFGLITFLGAGARDLPADAMAMFGELANDIGYALDRFSHLYREARTQYSLAQREAHLRALIDSAPAGIGVTVRRVLAEVNDRLCAMTGYEPGELVGESARVLYESDQEYERVGTLKYAQILATGRGQIVTRFKHKDGRLIEVLLSSQVIEPGDLDKGVVFTALDISETKEFERALRDTESRFRLLAENAEDIISVHDVRGICRFITPACARILGGAPEDYIGHASFEDVHRDDLGSVRARFTELLAGGEPDAQEYRLLRKDGTYVWVESKASLIMGVDDTEILVITRDISARKTAEARQGRYRQVVEGMRDGVVVFEKGPGNDFVIVEFNDAARHILAPTSVNVLGAPIETVLPRACERGITEVLSRVATTGIAETPEPGQMLDLALDGRIECEVFRLAMGELALVLRDRRDARVG